MWSFRNTRTTVFFCGLKTRHRPWVFSFLFLSFFFFVFAPSSTTPALFPQPALLAAVVNIPQLQRADQQLSAP